MKKIRSIVIILLCSLHCAHSSAQYKLTDEQRAAMQKTALTHHQNALKNSACVFEGTVTKQQQYITKLGETWTCTVFQITKIFKGIPSITLGSIKIITYQSTGSMIVSDGGPPIGKNGTYMIVGNFADSSTIGAQMPATDNSIVLTTGGIILIQSATYKDTTLIQAAHAEWLGGFRNPGTSYSTLDILYAFLKENGLTVQEEIPQQQITPSDTTKH